MLTQHRGVSDSRAHTVYTDAIRGKVERESFRKHEDCAFRRDVGWRPLLRDQ